MWLCWVFIAVGFLSRCGDGVSSEVVVCKLPNAAAASCRAWALGSVGFSSCGSRGLGWAQMICGAQG